MNEIFIGIDLAWGEKNSSGFCVLQFPSNSSKLEIVDIKLLKSIDDIVNEITIYKDSNVYIGIDAPLIVPNGTGNREIEKNFNKDFSKYKISMLPTNRNLLTKYSPKIRSEELYKKLSACGFQRDFKSDNVIFEVYPHATIGVCFNNYKILPYKRKKGRDTEFIKKQINIYKNYLREIINPHAILNTNIDILKGQKLKDYEDLLDSSICAYTMFYCKNNRCKFYKLDGVDTFVTSI